jgi:hypothetical protein
LIAEPWDCGPGGYQVGRFSPGWAEWNDRFRDTVRGFWKGDDGKLADFATRLSASPDLFDKRGRKPWASVNFITAHDGFTLNDLVSYNDKHNDTNGENNRDGHSHNISWNHGAEGPTEDNEIRKLRLRQMRNMLATVLLSRGTPMILAGDEFARTQDGNNNAYAQDNEISWLNWDVNRPFNCEFVSSTLRTTPSKAVALAPSELVGVVETGERGWRIRLPARHWIGRLSPENLSGRFDAIAGVMVLSEVAGRLMMMSGSGASTCTAGYGRAAASRLTEVTTTTVPAGTSPARRTGPGTFRMRSGRLCAAPVERGAIDPNAVKDDGDLAGNGDLRLFHTYSLCELHSPGLEGGPFFGPIKQNGRRLEQVSSEKSVSPDWLRRGVRPR